MRTLKRGLSGSDVRGWQEFLITQGFLAPGNAIGTFGPKTEAATKAFQTTFGLELVDGIVGPATLGKAQERGFIPPRADFGDLVAIPPNVNQGLTMVRQRTLLNVLGTPGPLSATCRSVTNTKLKGLLVTQDVGPFVVTGLRPAVAALTRVFARVRTHEPELFSQVGTAGMQCCRAIKLPGGGAGSTFSNHSWGTAIDLKINGALDKVADRKAQLGLLRLQPFFKAEKFFWGAGFGPAFEDAMHFEASEELVRDWQQQGQLGG